MRFCGLSLKPSHGNLSENRSWAQDLTGRDRDKTGTSAVESETFGLSSEHGDETEMRSWIGLQTVSRLRRLGLEPIPALLNKSLPGH